MRSFTGTGTLLRLAMRRDRIQLPTWLAVIVAALTLQVAGLIGIYDTQATREAYARVNAGSVAARLFGSIDGPTIGAITIVEIGGFLGVLVAVMSSMLVVRHTRQGEETGRLELVGAGNVGHHASLAAALLLALVANVAVAAGVLLTLLAYDLPATGCAITALGIAGSGVTFAALAAVFAQLCSGARLANGLGSAAIGMAFLVRGIGDVVGDVDPTGMAVRIGWPSWLSPLGWVQLAYPFSEPRWWALLPALGVAVSLAALAFAIESRRDFGQGVIAPRRRPERAGRVLSSTTGLVLRLERTMLVTWAFVAASLGVIVGAFASAVEDMLGANEAAAALFAALGGSDALIDNYYAIMSLYIGFTIAGFATQALQRMHAEERRGTLELALATSTGRPRWAGAHVLVVSVATVVLLAIAPIASIASSIVAGQGSRARDIIVGSVVQLPAIAVLIGVCVFGFGLLRRGSTRIGWLAYAVCAAVLFLQAADVPRIVVDLSPFSHVPLVPTDDVTALPMVVLTLVAVLLVGAGFVGFVRRDVH